MLMSQQEYDVHFQSTRRLHIRLELLNQFDNVIDRLDGVSTNGSINLSGKSTYRRTGNLSMVVNNKKVLPSPTSKIWFNRKVRIYTGLQDYNDKIHWFKMGIFLIKDADISHTKDGVNISIELLDSMANLDGTFSGSSPNEIKLLPEGVTISEAIKATVTSLGKISVDNIVVNGSEALLPYEITKEPNSTIYETLEELIQLYMGYEFFFNEDNYFIVQKIKDTKYDPISWDFTQNKMDLILEYSSKVDFSNVKNAIHVWGKKMDSGSQAYWVYKNKYTRNSISERNSLSNKQKGDICFVGKENKSYCWNGSNWDELNFNVIPEFNIENIGERNHVYSDDKIFNNDQAMLRAEYELEQKSNLAETVNISCLPIYFLVPNSKIKLYDEKSNIDGEYKINEVTIPLDISSSMSVSATKIYY